MIDASVLQLLLAVLTGWLDRREREVIDYLVAESVSCAGNCEGSGCS